MPSEGEVVRGKVLKITATNVLVDVGFKSEGVIPLAEFLRLMDPLTSNLGTRLTS